MLPAVVFISMAKEVQDDADNAFSAAVQETIRQVYESFMDKSSKSINQSCFLLHQTICYDESKNRMKMGQYNMLSTPVELHSCNQRKCSSIECKLVLFDKSYTAVCNIITFKWDFRWHQMLIAAMMWRGKREHFERKPGCSSWHLQNNNSNGVC